MFFGDIEQVTVEAPWGPWAVSPVAPRQTFLTHRGDPPEICIGDSEAAEVSCFAPDGRRLLLRWTSDPGPVTDAEVEAWRRAHVLDLGDKLDRGQLGEVLAQAPVPSGRPPFSGIHLDRVGNLWVEVGPNEEEESESTDYLVFDEAGALMGTVLLPSVRVLEIGGGHVLGVDSDELEVQRIRVFELFK
jgi:hypothetical protein